MPSGSQITYIDVLNNRSDLPEIKPAYKPGDYVLVGHDYTVVAPENYTQAPATMYVIQDGLVMSTRFVMSLTSVMQRPAECTGLELARQTFDFGDVVVDPADGAPNLMWGIGEGGAYRGNAGRHDYLVAVTTRPAEDQGASEIEETAYYFYLVTLTGPWSYIDEPLWLTAQMPFATETAVGGFLNVPDTALDAGYVYLDGTGHLRLLDYDLLRTGTLAYQLGSDVKLTGLTMDALQAELDDRVNERVVFPTAEQIESRVTYGLNPNVVELTVELVDDPNVPVVYIRGLDSRFGAAVYLHITGTATNATQLVISNCEKIRIDNNILGSPSILINNCGLYYDPMILDTLTSITGLTLWYEAMDSDRVPYLSVDGLTVSTLSPQVIPEEIDFWSVDDPNDNHFEYALRSITFNTYGDIVEASIMIRNNSTYNVDPGQTIYVSDFRLPQGTTLTYPRSRLTKQLRITGNFVSAYYSTSDSAYIVTDNAFTAVSQTYEVTSSDNVMSYEEHLGTLSLYANTVVTSMVSGSINDVPFVPGSAIDGWDPSSFHVFNGGIVS